MTLPTSRMIEFVGGPRDGDLTILRVGLREYRVPLPVPVTIADMLVQPYAPVMRVGIYRLARDAHDTVDILWWEGEE